MNEKIIFIILGIFLLLGILFFVSQNQWQQEEEADTLSRRAFSGNMEDVQSLFLDSRTESIEIKKLDGEWKITRPLEAEADKEKVEQLLGFFKDLKAERILENVSENEMESYGLVDPVRTIRIETRKGVKQLRLGQLSSTGQQVYAAREAEDDEVLVFNKSLNERTNLTAFGLREKSVFNFSPLHVQEIVYATGEESYGARQVAGGDWLMLAPEWAQADQSKIGTLIGQLSNLEAVGFPEGWEENFQQVARLEISAGTEEVRKEVLLIGPQINDDLQRVALRQSDELLVEIDAGIFSQIEDLLTTLRQRRLFSMEPYGMDRLEIEKAGEVVFSASRTPAGQWDIRVPGPGPGIGYVVQSYLGRLLKTEADVFVDDPEDLSRYQLDSPKYQITAEAFGQEETLLVGVSPASATESAQVENLFVKRPEEQTVMLAGPGLAELLFRDFRGMLEVSEE
jgi:hypothetical protein